jgi:hypothetical protein
MITQPIEGLAAAFTRACKARPDQVSDHIFSVGGAPVYARVAGTSVARILARSLVPGVADGPGLTLDLWDEEATAIAPVGVPSQRDGLVRPGPAGEQLGIWSGGRYVRYAGPDFEIRLDRASQRAVGWLRSERLLSSWHRARPLQTLFISWLGTRGMTAVHAAMVARGGTGVLLAGPPLSGKSTSIAACGGGGSDLLGDETIALQNQDGKVFGHCVHAALKLRREGLTRHPALAGRTHDCGPPWQDDAVAFLGEAFPGQVVASARVGAIGFPTVVDAKPTTFSPIGAGEAMRKLTGCMLSVEPGNVGSGFARIADLVHRLPCYSISVGTETHGIAHGLAALITHLWPGSTEPVAV